MDWRDRGFSKNDPVLQRSFAGRGHGADRRRGVLRERHAIPADDLGLWTHLVSDGRSILFYNADMRTGATARIDDDGVLGDQQDVSQVAIGLWTHLVA
jgi:hypothetical protein